MPPARAATITTTTTAATACLLLLPLLALAFFPPRADAFLLTGLVSRGRTSAAPPTTTTTGPLFSVDLQRGPPRLDEFGLPVDEEAERRRRPAKPFKEKFYDALDGAQGLVDTYIVRSGDSEAEQRRLQEATQAALRRRRAANSALKVKDKIVTVLDYSLHPGKAWHDLVAAPLSEARERDRAKKAARRRGLVQALQRYQAAKSRFYDTLDLVQESTRTTVRVAKQVGSAVAQAPQTAQGVVDIVQAKTEQVARVGRKVSDVVSSITGNKKTPPAPPAPITATAATATVEKKEAPPASAATAEPAADPEAVKTIWEKHPDAVKKIWETPAAPTAAASAPSAVVAVAPPKPQLSFRERVAAEEKERARRSRGGRQGQQGTLISSSAAAAAAPEEEKAEAGAERPTVEPRA